MGETETIKNLTRLAQNWDPRWKQYNQREQARADALKQRKKDARKKQKLEKERAEQERKRKIQEEKEEKERKIIEEKKLKDKRKKQQQKWKRTLKKLTLDDGIMKKYRKDFDILSVTNDYKLWEEVAPTYID